MLRRTFLFALCLILPGWPLLAVDTEERLLQQAESEAVGELKLHLLREYVRVSEVTAKVRSSERVAGWRRIRVSGDAAFATWSKHERDYIWRSGKFAVEFDLVNEDRLKAVNVMFDGITRPVDP